MTNVTFRSSFGANNLTIRASGTLGGVSQAEHEALLAKAARAMAERRPFATESGLLGALAALDAVRAFAKEAAMDTRYDGGYPRD